MTEKRTVDIIIPTYRPGKRFIALISMLQRQSVPYNRLIIINTEQNEMSEEALSAVNKARDAELWHIKKEEFDHAGTRKQAVLMSQADYFVCMTDDAVPADETLIGELLKPFSDKEIVAVYARQITDENAGKIEQITRRFNYSDENRKKTHKDIPGLGIKTYFCSNVCCAYDRAKYDSTGGFTDHAVFNEDMIFASEAIKKGYAVYYNASARVIHYHEYNAAELYRRNYDLGMSQAMNPDVFSGLSSENEGIRLLGFTAAELIRSGDILLLPKLFTDSLSKYAGFRAGRKAGQKLIDQTRNGGEDK